MKTFTFSVQGSAPVPYNVIFYFEKELVKSTCTCEAGNRNIHCKHRFEILNGKLNSIVSNNQNEANELIQLFKSTTLHNKMQELERLTVQSDKLKKEVNNLLVGN